MVSKQLLVAAVGLFALPCIMPAIGIDVIGGDPPSTLLISTDLGDVQASGVQPCPMDSNPADFCYVFNNDTGGIVTSLSFSATIAADLPTGSDGLPTDNGVDVFSCSQGPIGYFLGCNITYDSTSGLLSYAFSGVNPPQAGETCPFGNCAPDQRGIPPDTVPTNGEFTIELLAWTGDTTAQGPNMPPVDVFKNGIIPTITTTFTDTVPEPSTFVFLAIGFLIAAGAAQLRNRKLAASRKSA